MKYKICKFIDRTYKLNPTTELYELTEIEKYYALRKGRMFGFWHEVGEEIFTSGGTFITRSEFTSVSQAVSYIECWHKTRYGNKNYKKMTVEALCNGCHFF